MSVQGPPLQPPPARQDSPLPLLGREPVALRRAWFLATALGETAGFLVAGLVSVVAFDLSPMPALVLMVLAGMVEGLLLGGAQSVVLGHELLGFSRRTWAGATALASGGAWLVGMLVNLTPGWWTAWPLWLSLPAGLVAGLLLLSSIGLAQWLVLREHLPRSGSWVLVNAGAWALGLALFLAIATPLWHPGQSVAVVVAVGAVGGLAMAGAVGAITALWLPRLLRLEAAGPEAPAGVPAPLWESLVEPTDRYAVFDAGLLEGLPLPARRWLGHAITTGTTLLTGVETEGVGHVRIGGSWRRFTSRQRSSLRRGFVWGAHTRLGGLPVTGYDRFTGHDAEMHWHLLGRLRVATATGEEVSRSAAGRHAAEMLATAPAVALDPSVRWRAVDGRRATAHLVVGEEDQAVTITVDSRGRLCQVELDRWGTPPGQPYGRYRFGALLSQERMFDGYLVPTQVVAGWHIGTSRWDRGSFLRYRLMSCSFH